MIILTDQQSSSTNYPNIPTGLRLYDAESYPSWYQCQGIVAYLRHSPARENHTPVSPQWQLADIREFAQQRGLPIVATYFDAGGHGRRFGPTRSDFQIALAAAGHPRTIMLAWEWRRFARDLPKLASIAPDVDFVSIMPLDTPEQELRRIASVRSKRYADRWGGRPAYHNPEAFSIILQHLGESWRSIARRLNESGIPTATRAGRWEHKAAIRQFPFQYFNVLRSGA